MAVTMNYKTVFDIASEGYKAWKFVAPGFGFIVLCLLMVRFHKYLPFWPLKVTDKFKKGYAILGLAFCIFWTVTSFYSTYGQYHRLMKARNAGTYSTVEGKVTDFIPMPHEGHKNESFTVGGKRFEYSDFEVSAGFNNTASHGGPIKPGLQVRIAYVGNSIVKLEVVEKINGKP
jgi:hypothetical protein